MVLSGGTSPVYVPFGGDGLGSGTEANVQMLVQPILTTQNACINLSAAPGTGNSITVNLRDNGANTGITMTVANSNPSACDITHQWTNASGDLMDWSLTPNGTIAGFTPNVMISAQAGYLGTGGTLPCSQFPILTGDVNSSGGTCATSVVKVNGASVPSSTAVVGTNSSAQIIATTQALLNSIGYATGGGTANAQTVTLSPAIAGYTAGTSVCWLPIANNTTTTPTLNVNGLGAKTIIKTGANPLIGGDIATTSIACAIYDGTHFELQNPQTAGGGTGTVTSFSAGNLSPLFNTSVATASSTPVLSFTLSNAPGYSWLGNASSSSAAPSYNTGAFPCHVIMPALTGEYDQQFGIVRNHHCENQRNRFPSFRCGNR